MGLQQADTAGTGKNGGSLFGDAWLNVPRETQFVPDQIKVQ
jgi:hypothetical protein